MKSERVILEDCRKHFTKLSSERHQNVKEEGKRNVWFSFITAFGESKAPVTDAAYSVCRQKERDAKWPLWLSHWPSCLSDLINEK